MISKNTFVNIMKRLEALDNKMDKVDAAFKELSPDFCGFYLPECLDIVIAALSEVFNDKESDWLGYLVYELNFLNNFKMGMVTDKDNSPIDLSTWGEVYDFLIKNMEE